MTATLLDRDAHAGAAADARADRQREHAAKLAWATALYDAPSQLRAIAVMYDGFLDADGERIIPTHDADGGARDVFEQTDALVTYAGEVPTLRAENAELRDEITALRAQNARLLSQTPYSEDHRAALLAVYAKRAPVAQERAA